jgi:hypothetical protein
LATPLVTNAPRLHKSGPRTSPSQIQPWEVVQLLGLAEMTSLFLPLAMPPTGTMELCLDFLRLPQGQFGEVREGGLEEPRSLAATTVPVRTSVA